MKRKILTILLCGVMVLGMTGCGDDKKEVAKEDKVENKSTVDLKPFVRTYNILNIAESNDDNYIYLTIRQFQEEEVQTIKVERKLCPKIAEGKNYEFTIKPNEILEDNILSIFNNSTIVSIKETNKTGLKQIQEPIPERNN